MSKVIDTRVVEMQFDNSRFEKNVAESMSTLEKLKAKLKGLDDSSDALDQVGKAAEDIDLSKLDKSLETVTNRFSTMGIVGMTVIEDLTKSAMNMVKSFGSNIWNRTIGQIKAGGKARAANIESSKFLLEGMGITFNKTVEDQISEAVTDTAFGFDEAAMAMAQLSGAGVQLGDDMSQALKAISGVAAMTQRSFSDIADIFVDSAAAGKVAGDAFNRLGERGLGAKQIMMDFYGVTSDELDKLARGGMISFNDFSKAMYDAFGTQAKKANDTLEGVLANINSALSRIGAIFYQPLLANNSDIVAMLNSFKKIISDFKTTLVPTAKIITDYILSVARGLKRWFDTIKILDKDGNLTDLGKKFETNFTNIANIIINVCETIDNLRTNFIAPLFREIQKAFFDVFPELNTGKSMFASITEAILELTKKMREASKHIGIFGEKGSKVRSVFRAVFSVLRLIYNILELLAPLIDTVSSAAIVGITVISNLLSNLVKNFGVFVQKFKMIGSYIVSGIAYGIFEGVPALFNTIAAFAASVIEKFQSIFGIHSPSTVMALCIGLPLALGIAAGLLLGKNKVLEAIEDMFGLMMSFFDRMAQTALGSAIAGFLNALASVFNVLASALNRLASAITELEATKFLDLLVKFERFLILGGLVVGILILLKSSTWFATAMYNFSRAAKIYMYGVKSIWTKIPQFLENLALCISVIAFWVVFFSELGWDRVQDGLIIVGSIVGSLAAIILITAFLTKTIEGFDMALMTRLGFAFAAIGGSVWLIAEAANKLRDVPWQTIAVAFTGMIIMLSTVLFAMYEFKKLSWVIPSASTSREWLTLIAFAAAISMVVNAIIKMCLVIAIAPADILQKAISGIFAIMVVMGLCVGLVEYAHKLGKDQNMGASPAAAFLGLAISIGLIVGAVRELGMIAYQFNGNFDNLYAMVLGIIGVVGGMMALIALAGNVGTGTHSFIELAAALVAFGWVVKVFGESLNLISEIPEEKFNQAIGSMGLLMAFIMMETALMALITIQAAAMFASMGAFVAACGYVVSTIGSMQDGIGKGFAALVGIIAGAFGVIFLLGKMKGAKTNEAYKMLLSMAAIIAASALMIKICADLEIGQILKGGTVVAALLGFLTVIALLLSKFGTGGKIEEKNLKKSLQIVGRLVKSIIKIAVSIALIGLVLGKLSDNSIQAVVAGSIAMAVAIAGLALLVKVLMSFDGSRAEKIDKIAKPIKAISGAVVAVGVSLALLSIMPLDGLTAGAFALGIILALVANLLKTMRLDFENQRFSIKPMIASLIAVAVIAATLTVLATFTGDTNGWYTIVPAAVAIGICIGAVGLLVAGLNKMRSTPPQAAIPLIIGCVALVAAGYALKTALAGVGSAAEWQNYLAAAGGMFMCMVGVALAAFGFGIAVKALQIGTMIASVLLLGGLCYELKWVAEALNGLVGYNWESIKGAMIGLLGTLGIMAGIAGIIGAISLTGGGLAAFALGLLVLAGAIGELTWVSKILTDAALAVDTFGQAIQDHFNTQVASEAAAAMDTVVQSIVDGMTKLTQTIKDQGVLATLEMIAVMRSFTAESAKALGVSSPSTEFYDIAMWVIRGFIDGLEKFGLDPNTGVAAIGKMIFQGFIDTVRNVLKTHSDSKEFIEIAKDVLGGFKTGILDNLQMSLFGPGVAMGNTIVEGVKTGLGPLLSGKLREMITGALGGALGDTNIGSLMGADVSGGFSEILGSFDYSKLLGGDAAEFMSFIKDSGMTTTSMSSDAILEMVTNMKEAGVEGENLNKVLEQMGISLEDLKAAGVDISGMAGADALNATSDAAQNASNSLSDLASRIIKGEFKNAPERWNNMYAALIKEGKTAQEAYAAIAEAQNEVNKKYGSKVVHTADEIAGKISDTVKKANAEAAKLNENKKGKTEEKLTGKDKLAEEKEKQVALRDEQKKTATELTKQLEAQKIAIKKSIEMDDGKTEALVEEYNKLLAQKEAIDKGTESQKASTEAAEETGKTVAQNAVSQNKVEDATNAATEAQKKQTEAVKETTEAQKEQLRIKEQLEKPTHLTKSDVVKYGTQEYEELKSDMGINTRVTQREKAYKNTLEYLKEINKETTHLNKSESVKYGSQEYEDLKSDMSVNTKTTDRDKRFDVGKTYTNAFEKQEHIGTAIINTLFDNPAAKITRHGTETYETLGKSCVNAFFKSLTEEWYAKNQQIPTRLPEPMNGYVTPVDELYANAYEANKNKPQYSKFFSELDEAAKEAGASSSELYQYYFINGFDNTNMSVGEVGEKLKLKLLEESAKANGQAYQQGYKTYADYMKGSLDAMQQKNAEQAAAQNNSLGVKKDEALAKGKETGETFLKGVEAYMAMKNPVVALIDGFVKHKAEVDAKYQEGGESAVNKFTGGLNSPNIPDSKFRAPADRANRQIGSKEVRNAAYKDGENITLGVANGMTSPYALMQVNKAGTKVAATGDNAIRDYMKINSPSDVTYDEGVYVVRGYVNGILASLDMVVSAFSQIGSASLNVITPVVYGIQNAVQDGLDLTPVITPVINSSNIRTDLTAINDMLGQRHVASIEENFRATQDYKTLEAQNMQTRMSGMQDAINMLSAAMLNQPTPEVTANVVLQGDAGGVFRVVRQEDLSYRKMHGKSAFG